MKLALVLSGGGIIGVAHIGLLEQLSKHNIKINEIAACSSGAIVGSLYAAGGISRVDKFFQYLHAKGIFSKTKINLPNAIFNNFKKALEIFLEGSTFENLRIPLTVVATDISSGELIQIRQGNLVEAILCSAAYPGFFDIQYFQERHLIDGGVLANFPVMALKGKNDFILGSYLGNVSQLAKDENNKIKISKFSTFSRAIDIVQDQMSKPWVNAVDYCFMPPTSRYRWNNFSAYEDIKSIGKDYAKKEISKIIKLILKKTS